MIRYSEWIKLLAVGCLAVLVTPIGATPGGERIEFSSLDRSHPLPVSGTLYLPEEKSPPCPAVVMVHGTSGINSVGRFYQDSILQAGIAVFEVDFKTGIFTGPRDRPSPDALVAMGFAALKELRKRPAIDPDRIGIMGFSMGGHLTVNAAFEKNRKLWMGDEKGFATHAAFFPVCKQFSGAKRLPADRGSDDYLLWDRRLLRRRRKRAVVQTPASRTNTSFGVTTVEYAGARHDFNRNEPPLSYYDPAAIGGRGYMAWDADAANDSLTRVVDFLSKTLAAK